MTSGKWKGVSILLMFIFIAAAQAYDGTVNISGLIQDNTCELAPDSQNNNINMGVVVAAQFSRLGDFSQAKKFTIYLENCGPAASEATITFTGSVSLENDKFFSLDGIGEDVAKGLALGIFDNYGNIISPGQSSRGYAIKPNQDTVSLDFSARYVAVDETVTPGSADTTVTFIINYA
ncbi:fimbrial protein [Enterobacter quasiroggenkampii]|uniref:fimbrial protein n=1 Tax=Enterobacter quasiroggenkampii TaxID=2497436 RepID=UPI0021D257C4|nr:fimbrial protein [Enterobacter quasiroggenkampii]MCU6306628.1 fimbrial protein [Enterobacter quasiroggenkampii]MCU6398763.1 fimbrial protein [Enterobacter quasiroggenkampii]